MNKKQIFVTVAIIAALAAVAITGWMFFTFKHAGKDHLTNTQTPLMEATFVGTQACAGCHQRETEQWKLSDHHRAMEEANAATVLGNFNNVSFNYFGRKTIFAKQDGQFLVKTENEQGQTETFRVSYTLGYKPLQQYLVTFADGRIQALPFAWDTRPKAQGGQRWFHLYPGDNIKANNPLFWTRPLQNWNHMCADCHTTNYAKNFSDEKNTFDSHWSEIGNGCESCHGAGSAHVELMQEKKINTKPLLINKLATQTAQIDQCGVCHARRTRLKEEPGQEKILQSWQPELLHDNLYFTDGQMHDEVFNIGSFMQSKMYNAGVTCTNCHNPHSNTLVVEGNALCTQCHNRENYDTSNHHFHPQDSTGGKCVSCHMPTQTYMVVDTRHDHHFSIPRPDLSENLGGNSNVPNTCVSCHQEKMQQKSKNNTWAARVISKHLIENGRNDTRPEHFATIFWQARHEQLAAEASLKQLITDNSAPAIVKATAMMELANYLDPESLELVRTNLDSSDGLIRFAAVEALGTLPLEQRSTLLANKLADPSRAVRFAIAPLLAGANSKQMTSAQQKQLQQLFAEYKAWLLADSDRGSALANLANFLLMEGDATNARLYFEKALQRDAKSLSVLLNYADYHRSLGNDVEAEKLLRQALVIYPDSADAHYALGLLLVRAKNYPAAMIQLKQATSIAPLNSHYAYVYAIGLYSSGSIEPAFSALAAARNRFPANPQIASALQAYCAEQQSAQRQSRIITKSCKVKPQ
jgi:predicted CXXCH cytochrome family protein